LNFFVETHKKKKYYVFVYLLSNMDFAFWKFWKLSKIYWQSTTNK